MRLTKSQLKQIIKEELSENFGDPLGGATLLPGRATAFVFSFIEFLEEVGKDSPDYLVAQKHINQARQAIEGQLPLSGGAKKGLSRLLSSLEGGVQFPSKYKEL